MKGLIRLSLQNELHKASESLVITVLWDQQMLTFAVGKPHRL